MGAEDRSMTEGRAPSRPLYRRVIAHVRMTPWAIEPVRLCEIIDVLSFLATGGKMEPEEIREYVGRRDPVRREVTWFPLKTQATTISAASRTPVSSQGGGQVIAVIPVRGIIAHHIEQVDNISGPGGTSIEGLRGQIADAVSNPSVAGVMLDIDSPGGTVDGVPELAGEIMAARSAKPIRAVANSMAASAAYFLASAASEISVTPSGEVGSIGVYAAHSDLTGLMERRGERVTLIHAGKYKIEGNPFEPLSDEGRADLQSRVQAAYDLFVASVAEGRGVNEAEVRGGFGEGRVVGAQEAVRLGMADRVESLGEALDRMRFDLSPDDGAGDRRPAGRSAHEFAFLPR